MKSEKYYIVSQFIGDASAMGFNGEFDRIACYVNTTATWTGKLKDAKHFNSKDEAQKYYDDVITMPDGYIDHILNTDEIEALKIAVEL
jgi:hypothetical protein